MNLNTKDTLMKDQCAEAREQTVEETINARIEQYNRQIANLMAMRDSTPSQILAQPIHRFERLYGSLFGNRPF
jgi:hypothetical protein